MIASDYKTRASDYDPDFVFGENCIATQMVAYLESYELPKGY